jgi:hypothetical protein
MPDKENTFVLKADGAMEYLIEAKDAMDMKSWIATIRYCMKTTPTSQMPSHSLDDPLVTSNPSLPNTSLISSTGSITEASAMCAPSSSTASAGNATASTLNNNNVYSTNNNQASSSQPEIPPRRPEASNQFHLDEDDLEHESDLTAQMNEYPW